MSMQDANRRIDTMLYGSNRQTRREPERRASDDVAELGKTAVKGIATVGVVGATAYIVGGMLGSLK